GTLSRQNSLVSSESFRVIFGRGLDDIAILSCNGSIPSRFRGYRVDLREVYSVRRLYGISGQGSRHLSQSTSTCRLAKVDVLLKDGQTREDLLTIEYDP
ncbi:Unknown protein, partial [Striga hermonthica]